MEGKLPRFVTADAEARRRTNGPSTTSATSRVRPKNKLVIALRDYAKNTLDGDCQTGILSALINAIDTIQEGNLKLTGTQAERERQLVEFILAHDENNRYDT